MINITHFVNPNKIFFMRQKDSDFDKQLDEMEVKLKGTVAKKKLTPDDAEEEPIQVNDIIAVFWSSCNKWIRGAVKEIATNGIAYVWAIDYGMPMISHITKLVALPAIYSKMNFKHQRVHFGSLINCVPAASSYDIEKDCVIMSEQQQWSMDALNIAQSLISRAIQLKFDEMEEVKMSNGTTIVCGHLNIQKADGSWIDLNRCLSNALVAKSTSDTWSTLLHRLDTVNQKEWKAMDGKPLRANIIVSLAATSEYISTQSYAQPICKVSASVESATNTNDIDQRDDVEPSVNNTTNNQPSFNGNFSNKRGIISNRNMQSGYNRNARAPRNSNFYRFWQDDNGGAQSKMGWQNNGKLNDPRYLRDIEYFESAFERPSGKDSSKFVDKNDSPQKVTNESDKKPIKTDIYSTLPSTVHNDGNING